MSVTHRRRYGFKFILIVLLGVSSIVSILSSPLQNKIPEQQEKPSQHIHFLRAEEYRQAKEDDTAIEEYYKSIEFEPDYAWAYRELIRALMKKGEPEKAQQYMESLIERDSTNASALYGLGYFFFTQEDWDEGTTYLKKAVQINPQLGNAHLCLGNIYFLTGRLDQALECYQLSLSLFQTAKDKRGQAHTITNIGAFYRHLGNLQEAFTHYLEALNLAREIGVHLVEIVALNNIAEFYQVTGDLTQALDYYTMSLQLSEDVELKTGKVASLNYIGSIYYDLGDLSRALEFQKEALKLHTEMGIKLSQAIDLGDMAVVYRGLGNLSKARECLEESLNLERELQAKNYEAKDLNSMAEIYRELGNLSASKNCCSQALQLYRELGDRVGEANSLVEMGLIYLDFRDYAQALKCFNESLRMAEEIHIPETIWRCQKNLGDVYVLQNRFNDALLSYRSSIEAIEVVRKKLEIEKFKTSFMESKMEVYEKIVNVLIRMDKKSEAFQYTERAKARALLEMLTEARIDIHKGVAAELFDQEHEIFRNISGIQTDLQNPDLIEGDRQNLISDLQEQEERLEYLQLELRKENPMYADLLYPEPYSVENVQREVVPNEDTILLEYLLGETQSYLWIVTKGRLDVLSLPPREEIEFDVRRLLSVISQPPTQRLFYDISHRLCKLLLPADKIDFSQFKNLIIIPDGILFYLPFEVLVQSKSEGTESEIEYVIENFDMSYAPSASTLALIYKKRLKREQPTDMLIFADPFYGEDETKGEPTKETAIQTIYDEYSFPRLRFSGQEARAIASLYPEEKVRMFLREAAREEEVKTEEFQGCRILHFAAHGVLDETVPRRSGVVLALDGDPTKDGFLQIHEIFNLRVEADIVVLSACKTGLGKLVRGEGIIGLSRAFFYAGASSVVASLWSVNDRSTALLMTHFYEGLRDGMEKRKALREAKLNLLAQRGRLAHPYYWAPFVLMGDYK